MKLSPKRIFISSVIVLVIAYVSYGLHRCSEEGDVVKLEFKEFNPPIYDFPFSIDSVRNAITVINKYIHNYTIYEDNYRMKLREIDLGEYSYIYQYRKKREYIRETYDLVVILDSLGVDSTRVIIEKHNNKVYYGVKIWKYLGFTYYFYKNHNVSTPSIREYEYLRILGKQLGYLKNMPFTKYPKELSQKKIIEIFGRPIPFTLDEMFEYPEKDLEQWCKKNKIYFKSLDDM